MGLRGNWQAPECLTMRELDYAARPMRESQQADAVDGRDPWVRLFFRHAVSLFCGSTSSPAS